MHYVVMLKGSVFAVVPKYLRGSEGSPLFWYSVTITIAMYSRKNIFLADVIHKAPSPLG